LGTKKGLADPLKQLEQIIGLLRLVANTTLETGKLTSPAGIPYVGFKITLGKPWNPADTVIIDNVLKPLKEHITADERDVDGHFRRLSGSFT